MGRRKSNAWELGVGNGELGTKNERWMRLVSVLSYYMHEIPTNTPAGFQLPIDWQP